MELQAVGVPLAEDRGEPAIVVGGAHDHVLQRVAVERVREIEVGGRDGLEQAVLGI